MAATRGQGVEQSNVDEDVGTIGETAGANYVRSPFGPNSTDTLCYVAIAKKL